MEFGERGGSSCHGLQPRVERLVEKLVSVSVDPHAPIAIPLVEGHAYNARGVVALPAFVATIVGIRRYSKIVNTVVRTLAIYVVNLALVRRPKSDEMAPCNMMRVIIDRIWIGYLNLNVTLHRRAGDRPRISRVPFAWLRGLLSPAKDTGIWIVVEKAANQLRTKWRSAFYRHVLSSLERGKDYPGLPFMSTVAHNA
jgi:hypothetical protein